MLICEAIANIKSFCEGTSRGVPIGENTRDQVLWGDDQRELTGVVTCLWASTDVIRAAHERGANLIVCHESLFWNHGDHTDWLEAQGNEAFYAKRQLLEETGVCVWRFHDYIHSGVPARLFGEWGVTGPLASPDSAWVDGIFSPLSEKLGFPRLTDPGMLLFACFDAEGMSAHQLARKISTRLGLSGLRLEGDPRTPVNKAAVAMHLMGQTDNHVITLADVCDVDCIICMERTDYTVCQWVRDSCQTGHPRAVIDVGHYNLEEPGMEACATWLPEAMGNPDVPVSFVATGDPFSYVM